MLLCSMRLHPGTGRLDMRPGLPPDDGGDEGADQWHAVAGTRYEWRLRNLAESLSSEQQAAEVAAERALRLQVAMAHARAPSQLDFTLLPQGSARLHHFVELVAAKGFGPTPLYIGRVGRARLAPPHRRLARARIPGAAPRGASGRAVLGFPIELAVETEGAPVSKRPPLTVFFSVMSIDAWRRHKALGYTYLALQPTAGTKGEEVRCWKVGESRSRALDAFFVGGSEAITDMRALAIPDGHVRRRPAPSHPTPAPPGAAPTAPLSSLCAAQDGPFLSKHGLDTVTTGMLELKTSTVLQQAPPVAQPASKRAATASAAPTPAAGRPKGRRCRCARSRSSGRRRRRATACASGSRSARSRRARSPRRRRRARAARARRRQRRRREPQDAARRAQEGARSRSSPRSWAEGKEGGTG